MKAPLDKTTTAFPVMRGSLQNKSNSKISKTPVTASLTFQVSELTPCRTKVLIKQQFEKHQQFERCQLLQ